VSYESGLAAFPWFELYIELNQLSVSITAVLIFLVPLLVGLFFILFYFSLCRIITVHA
jgi:hypothetical protein